MDYKCGKWYSIRYLKDIELINYKYFENVFTFNYLNKYNVGVIKGLIHVSDELKMC